ncbi:hypothetical protein C789_4252 [Microcystis aeruginosa FACHB-905 = DIANCHI905]|nr:hypothetical protein BH695_4226 [Microcystis aeruginosa PCC 7806SL]ELS45920.1 hypothetical protein C789_4252 [Microcystis aeruginosa FACHB-905 = DIANCHI905]
MSPSDMACNPSPTSLSLSVVQRTYPTASDEVVAIVVTVVAVVANPLTATLFAIIAPPFAAIALVPCAANQCAIAIAPLTIKNDSTIGITIYLFCELFKIRDNASPENLFLRFLVIILAKIISQTTLTMSPAIIWNTKGSQENKTRAMTISRVNLKAWDVSKLCNNQFGFIVPSCRSYLQPK